MKNKDNTKLDQIRSVCDKLNVRCPASAAQASMKSVAIKILEIIDAE